MVIAVGHIAKKDIAKKLGKVPQAFSRMLNAGYHWTFDDMMKISNILSISLSELTNPELTPARVLEIQKNCRSESERQPISSGAWI